MMKTLNQLEKCSMMPTFGSQLLHGKIGFILVFLTFYSTLTFGQTSSISPWQMHEGTEGKIRFTGRNDAQRREAFGLAKMPTRDQSGWTAAETTADGTIKFNRKSVLTDCFEELDFTYFQTIVHIPDNVNVTSFIVSMDQGDDAARIYLFNSKHPNGYFDPASDLLTVEENFRAKDLKNQIVKGEDNRILIVQYDQCPDGNSVDGIRINVNDEEVKATTAQTPGNSLKLNESLKTNEKLVSANGMYHLVLESSGNVCIYKNKTTLIWSSKTTGKEATKLIFNKDGNLHLLNARSVYIWGSGQIRTAATRLVLENSGELISYDAAGKVIWTNGVKDTSMSDSDRLMALNTNDNFSAGKKMYCASGEYYLTLQTDGDLRIYNTKNALLWSSFTAGSGASSCKIHDGFLTLFNANGGVVWSFASYYSAAQKCSKVLVDNGGYLVFIDAAGKNVGTSVITNSSLVANQALNSELQLFSANGEYNLTLINGNLCIYRNKNTLIWSSFTAGSGATSCKIHDGFLTLFNANGGVVWSFASYYSAAQKCSKVLVDNGGYLVFIDAAGKNVGTSVITNSSLVANQALNSELQLFSANGEYNLTLINGNLCIYRNKNTLIWSSMTAGSGATTCRIQDGFLHLYNSKGASIWSTAYYFTAGQKCSRMSLDDKGYLAFYDAAGKSVGTSASFSNSFASGQSFGAESQMYSGNGSCHMAMNNGSLCIYKNKTNLVWSSMTGGSGATSCRIQDGYLQLYNAKGESVWSTASYLAAGKKCSMMSLDDNGYLVFYDASGASIGNSASYGSSFAGGQIFTAESQMYSGNGSCHMAFNNGSLCIYKNKTNLVWSSMTGGSGATSCRIQDGYLQLYNAKGESVWSTGSYWTSGSKCSRITLDDNGYLVFYDTSGKSIGNSSAFNSSFTSGQSFTADSRMTCASGAYYMAISNGSICIFNSSNALIWSTMTSGLGGVSCRIQDGYLQLFNAAGNTVWSTQAFWANSAKCSRFMLDDKGYLVFYDASGKTIGSNAAFMSVMYDLQSLSKGESLVSASGEYHVILQDDGNFCIYKNKTTFVWCSMSNGKGVVKYGFKDGNLCGFNAKGESVWSTAAFMTSGSKGVRLVMENSGILTMYDGAGKSVWTHQASASSSGASANSGLVKNGTFDGQPSSSHWTVELAATDQQQGGNSGGCMWLNHNGGATDPAISQVISGLKAGLWYKISGEYKGGKNVHLHYKDKSKHAFSCDINGVSILKLALPDALETWTRFEAFFRAEGTSCTLRFRGEIDGTDGDVMLDNIKMEESAAPVETPIAKLPDVFKLHAYSIHGKRVEKGSDYWIGYAGTALDGKIIAESAGTVLQIEKVVIDATKGIVALKVTNAPQADMYLTVSADKNVRIGKIDKNTNHQFVIRAPEEKEAQHLNYISFESVTYPNWYLRHQGFVLKVSPGDDNSRRDIVYRQDATWLFVTVLRN